MKRLFTSESVTEGHPDKICDQISDAILDAIYEQDPKARVACETFATTGSIFVMGEITTTAYVDIPKIVRQTLREIGYTDSTFGFDADTCAVITSIHEQSPDIAQGVDTAYEVREGKEDRYNQVGAGDQGMVFGYACNETETYMPLPISLAHKLAKQLAEIRKNGTAPFIRPDGKTQVTVEYVDGKPHRITNLLISTQHAPDCTRETLEKTLWEQVVLPIVDASLLDKDTKFLVNPTGKFVVGGPMGDTGLTGRKIIVDTYGGFGRCGGGAFSGKDPTKVDRSANYYARYIAKNLVAAGLCEKAEVGIAYAIGVAHPMSLYVDTFGTGKYSDEQLCDIVQEVFDPRPAAIIDQLQLRRPMYRQTAAYGHFGRDDLELPWEHTDRVEVLQKYLK